MPSFWGVCAPGGGGGRFVRDVCGYLAEPKVHLVRNAVRILGPEVLASLLREVEAVEKCGGQMTLDGRRKRTRGGVLWNIVKARVSREVYLRVMADDVPGGSSRERERQKERQREKRRRQKKRRKATQAPGAVTGAHKAALKTGTAPAVAVAATSNGTSHPIHSSGIAASPCVAVQESRVSIQENGAGNSTAPSGSCAMALDPTSAGDASLEPTSQGQQLGPGHQAAQSPLSSATPEAPGGTEGVPHTGVVNGGLQARGGSPAAFSALGQTGGAPLARGCSGGAAAGPTTASRVHPLVPLAAPALGQDAPGVAGALAPEGEGPREGGVGESGGARAAPTVRTPRENAQLDGCVRGGAGWQAAWKTAVKSMAREEVGLGQGEEVIDIFGASGAPRDSPAPAGVASQGAGTPAAGAGAGGGLPEGSQRPEGRMGVRDRIRAPVTYEAL